MKEVEGHDVESDSGDTNAALRQDHDHELEFKLLLSKSFKGWNVALNPLLTKNLSPSKPWEFGYAVGASRPLALKASRTVAISAARISLPERSVWRSGRYPEFWTARNVALSRARGGLEPSFRLDSTPFARIRLERQQPPAAFALGRLQRILRLWRADQRIVPGRPMKAKLNFFGVAASTAILTEASSQDFFPARAQDNVPATERKAKWGYYALTDAPVKAREKTNPLALDPTAARAGRKLFEQHCAECHGRKAEAGEEVRACGQRGVRGRSGSDLLDSIERSYPARNAGLVETA